MADATLPLRPHKRRVLSWMFGNAGATYNTGNWIALLAALLGALDAADRREMLSNLGAAFVGSAPALSVSAGSLAFFLGGARYDHAFRIAGAPDARSLREGHLLSAVGAALVAIGVAGLATSNASVFAALCGGLLHTAGKLGSAVDERRAFWKVMPLVSRLPSVLSLAANLGSDLELARVAATLLLILCVAIWARADALLLSDSQAVRLADIIGVGRTPPLPGAHRR